MADEFVTASEDVIFGDPFPGITRFSISNLDSVFKLGIFWFPVFDFTFYFSLFRLTTKSEDNGVCCIDEFELMDIKASSPPKAPDSKLKFHQTAVSKHILSGKRYI